MGLALTKIPNASDASLSFAANFVAPDLAPLSQQELTRISPLTADSAAELWDNLICANPVKSSHPHSHTRLLPTDHWLNERLNPLENNIACGPSWTETDNERINGSLDGAKRFVAFLVAQLPWDLGRDVIFLTARDRAITCTLSDFIEHWPRFLNLYDEFPLLLSLRSETIGSFPYGGHTLVGARPLAAVESNSQIQ